MAAPNPVRIIPSTSGNLRAGGEYVIRDEFTTDRAAGAVHNTAAEPGPGTRTVVDTESKLTIAGGALTFAGGKAVPGNGDPGASLNSVVRVPGRAMIIQVTPTQTNKRFSIGFDTDTLDYTREHGVYFENNALLTIYTSGNSNTGFQSYAAEAQAFAFCLRATGMYLLRKITTGYWSLVFVVHTQSTSPLFPAIRGNTTAFTSSYLRIPLARWLPTPIVSHGFNSAFATSDGLGHAEGVAGGIGAGGAGVTFSNAGNTWSVSAGKAINTPTLGAEQASGTLATHVWYKITATEADHFYVGCAVNNVFRAAATTALDANNKVKALALTEILSVANLACADVLAGVALTRSSLNVQAGLALNWDSPTSPVNGVVVYIYSGSILVDKCVAGAWSNVSTTGYTYSAGARLVVQKSGTSYRTYYNNALVKADTIADAGILSNTYHGLFSTAETNTFDDLAIYATGTSNEYAALDAF